MNKKRSSDKDIVHWTMLQGNRWSKSLHGAMLLDSGYLVTQKVAVIGKARSDVSFSVVKYDREYVIGWLASKVIKPLGNEGIDGVIKLVEQASENAYPSATKEVSLLQESNDG